MQKHEDEIISAEGKFTGSDIAITLGMKDEEKTISRVLTELKKCHP